MSDSFTGFGSFERIHPGDFVRKVFMALHESVGSIFALVAIKSAAGRMGREVADIGLREAEQFIGILTSSAHEFGLPAEIAPQLRALLDEELRVLEDG